MKRVRKQPEPATLHTYRVAVPNGTWEQMRDDVMLGGQLAYSNCRAQSIGDQAGLCAYCEIDIRDNDPLKCHVEHFHPKSDAAERNWALDWQNMLGVCNGGSHRFVTTPGFVLEPLAENLSCDAYKDHQVQSGALAPACEGWILNPLELRAFPSLFKVSPTDGHLEPDVRACLAIEPWAGNNHATVVDLAQHTIDMLNLNCDRLKDARLVVVRDIERNKKRQREQGFDAAQGLANLTRFYFRRNWPRFFTVIRACLGDSAENYLRVAGYQG